MWSAAEPAGSASFTTRDGSTMLSAMGEAASRVRMTEAEYLAFERASPDKHEYADGEIFAMAGGTSEHAAVSAGVIGEQRNALAGQGWCHGMQVARSTLTPMLLSPQFPVARSGLPSPLRSTATIARGV